MSDPSQSSPVLTQLSAKLQRIRTAHNHNSAVVTNLRTQLAEAEELFAKNGDDIQSLVKEIERLKCGLRLTVADRKSKSEPVPKEPGQVVADWVDGVAQARHESPGLKRKTFSPFAPIAEPEPKLPERKSVKSAPVPSTETSGTRIQAKASPPSASTVSKRSIATPAATSKADHHATSPAALAPRYSGPPPSYAESLLPQPAKPLPSLRPKNPSPPGLDLNTAAPTARSTSPSPSPQPFTNFTLTTLPDAIHSSFPTILSINGHWMSVTCAYCGANACSKPGGGRGFLKGLLGITSHMAQAHGPRATGPSKAGEGEVCLAEILDHCQMTEVSARDAKLLAGGLQAVERPVKRVTIDYEVARAVGKLRRGGEVGGERQRMVGFDRYTLRDDREESSEGVAAPDRRFSTFGRGLKAQDYGDGDEGERCGGKRKNAFYKGGARKRVRFGEISVIKVEGDDGDGDEMEMEEDED